MTEAHIAEVIWQAGRDTDPSRLASEDMVKAFQERWGDFAPETLRRALEHPTEPHVLWGWDFKVLALFALGYLAPAGIEEILTPFLQAEKRKERWATAIALGRLRDERVFPLLQELLVDGLSDALPTEDQIQDYGWFLSQRWTIAGILGEWGNPQAIPALRQALGMCWHLEQRPAPFGDGSWKSLRNSWWHSYEDHLCYALGQLGAWGTLIGLDLDEVHLKIAMFYYALGTLGMTDRRIFNSLNMCKLWRVPEKFQTGLLQLGPHIQVNDPRVYEILERPGPWMAILEREFAAVAKEKSSFVDQETVMQVLEERYGFSKEEQQAYVVQFHDTYETRYNEE
ncbi:MAG: HEAT repeat domain-containing protein [Ktedonobacteraceae bacterium]|nr:HEAT repeat domain-containing protein [Ktedonobacteraceae bacterium]